MSPQMFRFRRRGLIKNISKVKSGTRTSPPLPAFRDRKQQTNRINRRIISFSSKTQHTCWRWGHRVWNGSLWSSCTQVTFDGPFYFLFSSLNCAVSHLGEWVYRHGINNDQQSILSLRNSLVVIIWVQVNRSRGVNLCTWCSWQLIWFGEKEMASLFRRPILTEPVHSGLFFSLLFQILLSPFPTHSSPPTIPHLTCPAVCACVCVYMRFISWATATPQSTADRPANWTCPLLSLSPFLFLLFLKNQIENNRKIFFSDELQCV